MGWLAAYLSIVYVTCYVNNRSFHWCIDVLHSWRRPSKSPWNILAAFPLNVDTREPDASTSSTKMFWLAFERAINAAICYWKLKLNHQCYVIWSCILQRIKHTAIFKSDSRSFRIVKLYADSVNYYNCFNVLTLRKIKFDSNQKLESI